VVGVVGVNPKCMVITVHPAAFAAGFCEGLPSITGISKGICWPVNSFGILGVYNQCAEVEWPGDDIE
jgi:hypothetical protein